MQLAITGLVPHTTDIVQPREQRLQLLEVFEPREVLVGNVDPLPARHGPLHAKMTEKLPMSFLAQIACQCRTIPMRKCRAEQYWTCPRSSPNPLGNRSTILYDAA